MTQNTMNHQITKLSMFLACIGRCYNKCTVISMKLPGVQTRTENNCPEIYISMLIVPRGLAGAMRRIQRSGQLAGVAFFKPGDA